MEIGGLAKTLDELGGQSGDNRSAAYNIVFIWYNIYYVPAFSRWVLIGWFP